MTNNSYDTLGTAVQQWDSFYQQHRLWVIEVVSCVYPAHKERMAECVFTKVFFKNPAIIATNDSTQFQLLVAVLFPELADAVQSKSPKAVELLAKYYCPN